MNVGSSIVTNKYTTLVGAIDLGEVYISVAQRVQWKSLYFPLNFAKNLKVL